MLNSFLIVWNTPPVEMGQYDKSCFNKNQKWLICAPESLHKGKSELSVGRMDYSDVKGFDRLIEI